MINVCILLDNNLELILDFTLFANNYIFFWGGFARFLKMILNFKNYYHLNCLYLLNKRCSFCEAIANNSYFSQWWRINVQHFLIKEIKRIMLSLMREKGSKLDPESVVIEI